MNMLDLEVRMQFMKYCKNGDFWPVNVGCKGLMANKNNPVAKKWHGQAKQWLKGLICYCGQGLVIQ